MTRTERNEYNYIRSYKKKGFKLDHGTTLTIRTNAGAEYKRSLDTLYRSWGFHPASIRIDSRMYDENERIIYIFGQTWKDNDGNDRSWEELYTREERTRFEDALN